MNKIQQNLERLKSQIETSNSEDILLEANKLLLQAKQINFVSGIITALIILARVHWLREEYDPSVELIKEAESYHNNQDNDEILPEILHLYALNALSCSQHYTAKKYWLDALDKAMFTNNMVIEIESLLGIGDVLFSLEEYARSIEIFELAVQIANKTKNRKLEVRAYILLAKSYFELNHYIDMLTVLDLAEEKVDGKQCPTWNIKLWLLKSSALLKLNRIKDAKNAAFQAYNLSMSTSATNLRIHALGCLSKIALASDNHARALYLSDIAEAVAMKVDDKASLAKIYLYQSQLHQEVKDYQAALSAFKKYKTNTLEVVKGKTNNHNLDKNYKIKNQLAVRITKSINYLKSHHASDNNSLNTLISETTWWEKLMIFKASLNNNAHSVIMFYHDNPRVIDECEKLISPLCVNNDFLSRLNHKRLGLLIFGLDSAETVYKKIKMILRLYPWDRKGLIGEKPAVSYQDVLSFPFTIEQLDGSLNLEELEEY
ncbi:putative TPR-like family protein [Vibrio cincinnatiensis]|uniref:Tetratricopeptide repeat-containing protein n=2 Tax=Vibrio cincinnatiensis TaxID=675 RepID=A0A1T4Q933_VIBCI|nr:tetratricopeptide repeat protein [Vibrio cincinnatiensis]SKA00205.1 Tetratricopeptide repeat-containing protein [Vibrio cincinnatiensis DSM 19608]SUP05030.1 putative TPR-like family protein [Vibrio cincinnatiensis]